MKKTTVLPEVRKKSNSIKFSHKVDDWEEERKSTPRDSDMLRCRSCRLPSPHYSTKCRFCGTENWYGRYD